MPQDALECSSSAARLGFAGAFRRSELSRDVADLTETRLPAADVGAATKAVELLRLIHGACTGRRPCTTHGLLLTGNPTDAS
jgi:hypothetical protein